MNSRYDNLKTMALSNHWVVYLPDTTYNEYYSVLDSLLSREDRFFEPYQYRHSCAPLNLIYMMVKYYYQLCDNFPKKIDLVCIKVIGTQLELLHSDLVLFLCNENECPSVVYGREYYDLINERVKNLLQNDVENIDEVINIDQHVIAHNKMIDTIFLSVYSNLVDLLEKHQRSIMVKLRDMEFVRKEFNNEYVWYRDEHWKHKKMNIRGNIKMMRNPIDYCRFERMRCESMLRELSLFRVHSMFCEDDIDVCTDYEGFIEELFRNMAYYNSWSMNDLYEYFDCILTIEYLSCVINHQEYRNHDII